MFQGSKHPSNYVQHIKENEIDMCQKCFKNRGSSNCVEYFCGKCCRKYNKRSLFCPQHHLRRAQKAQRKVKYSTSLKILPPWLKYPHYGYGFIGWRMGIGQDYWHKFWNEYLKLSSQERKWYKQDFPEIPGWENIYNFIENEWNK